MPPLPKLARLLLAAALLCGRVAAEEDWRGRQFFGWDDFTRWTESPVPGTNQWVLESEPVRAAISWDEAVLSWNADAPPGTGLKLELARLEPAPASRFYVLGLWSSDPASRPRESVRGQKDDLGEVQTDTLVMREVSRTARIRITLTGSAGGARPRLKFVGLSFTDSRVSPAPLPPDRGAWGRDLPVPGRTQVIYPEGITAWCSPTSLSMLLAYWADRLGRPDLNVEVPDVAKAVFDPQWPGTGNWVFNTAYAGSFPGLRAYVTRFGDVSELERCVAADVPVAVSVSYNLLRGEPRVRDDGHLVVVRGFTAEGDPVVNDPGTGGEIRRVFRRAHLIQAWAVSHNTVYVVHPLSRSMPRVGGAIFDHGAGLP